MHTAGSGGGCDGDLGHAGMRGHRGSATQHALPHGAALGRARRTPAGGCKKNEGEKAHMAGLAFIPSLRQDECKIGVLL